MSRRTKPQLRRPYFGYGSNLWIDQMNRRCPDNKLVGLGILRGWKWIINNRGYANVVRSPEDLVYGLVYELGPTDEATLDQIESSYSKHTAGIELQSEDHKEGPVVKGLVYVDEKRIDEAAPREEYIHRMNRGIDDAIKKGLPKWYIDKYLRKFIPAGDASEATDPFGPE
ncbi:hypothetical protein BJ322DRAFT_1072619 [Thelephora terrestris]|uniref:gamma-glutamylcyclotransferase n=1 Tax=Thelephora terrestris TaxID=56493 RepID=A0A9P6L4V1_9AGAM|nr:hypothetical protein BJ322DRAFT_1072619 [Thelephora terrestris]